MPLQTPISPLPGEALDGPGPWGCPVSQPEAAVTAWPDLGTEPTGHRHHSSFCGDFSPSLLRASLRCGSPQP